MKILHFSDVHVQVDYGQIGLWNLDWRRLLAQLEMGLLGRARNYVQAPGVIDLIAGAAERHGADHLVLSGDLTGLAFEEEFIQARAALRSIAQPSRLSVVPGNHDRYTPESLANQTFERHFGDLLQSDLPEYQREGPFPCVRLLGDEVAVVGLNSARVLPFPSFAYGIIGKAQLAGLAEILSDVRVRDRMVFVAIHHCPLRPWGGWDYPGHGLVDAGKLLGLLKGPKRAILSGHIHQRYWLPANEERPHIFCAGSSTCSGEEGYWLINVQDGVLLGAEKRELGITPALPEAIATARAF